MVKKIVFVGISVLLILTGVFFIFFKKDDIPLYPAKNLDVVFYNDAVDHGNSRILQQEVGDQSVQFGFSLDSAFLYPYCGFGFRPKEVKSWDFSQHNSLQVKFKTQNLSSVFMYLHVFEPKVKNTDNRLASRRLLKSFTPNAGSYQTFEIPFEELETPTWWYNIIRQDKSEFGDPDYSQVQAIHFANGLNCELNTPYNLQVAEITVTNNYLWTYIILGAIWLVSVSVYSVILFVKTEKKLNSEPILPELSQQEIMDFIPKVEVTYKPIEVDPDKKLVFVEYINSNFQDPDLTLTSVAEKFGFSERSISNHISETYGCYFKTYLNGIRINEAKRLLENEELASGEVAYLVGFNSPANFNRVFKNIVGMSPTEYMNNLQKA